VTGVGIEISGVATETTPEIVTETVGEAAVEIAEIQADRDVQLAEIASDTATDLAEIQTDQAQEDLEWLASRLDASEALLASRLAALETMLTTMLDQHQQMMMMLTSLLTLIPPSPQAEVEVIPEATPPDQASNPPAENVADRRAALRKRAWLA
jgi:hypothetical protein